MYGSGANLFSGIYSQLASNLSNQADREKVEDMAVMIGSVAIAEAVPGLGEVQMGLQFLDFIDPYGYNQAVNRSTLDQILSGQYSNITNLQQQIATCYQSGDSASCSAAGISADDLATFQQQDPSFQAKQIKAATSWLTPYPPEVKYPQMFMCTLSHDPGRIQQYCQDPDYKADYLQYFSENQASYQANAAAAEAAAAQNMANSLSGDTVQDLANQNKKREMKVILVLIWVVVTVLVYQMLKRVLR